MWLFGSKLHETFPIVIADGNGCEAHEKGHLPHYSSIPLKRVNIEAKVCCPSLSWGSFLESWSQHLCHHLQVWTRALGYYWTYHVGAKTHCLTGDKHLGCYSPPPLKESRPEIRCERLLWEEKLVIQFPTSVIALGYLTLEYQRD